MMMRKAAIAALAAALALAGCGHTETVSYSRTRVTLADGAVEEYVCTASEASAMRMDVNSWGWKGGLVLRDYRADTGEVARSRILAPGAWRSVDFSDGPSYEVKYTGTTERSRRKVRD